MEEKTSDSPRGVVPRSFSSSTIRSDVQMDPRFLFAPRDANEEARVCVKRLDHYTLIVDNAKQVADFHIHALNSRFMRIQKVNTGTVGPEDFDMVNYILSPPNNPDVVLVVTEGLNEDTIFQKYMKKRGQGIHHVAFEVDNVDRCFSVLKERGVKTTSNKVTTDMLSGLKLFFIEPEHAGIFIELIERSSDSMKCKKEMTDSPKATKSSGFFTQNNMAELAKSIQRHVDQVVADPSLNEKNQNDLDALALGRRELRGALDGVDVGPMKSMTFYVSDPYASAQFLVGLLGFRLVEFTDNGTRSVVSTVDNSGHFTIVFEMANEERRERSAYVSFGTRGIEHLGRHWHGVNHGSVTPVDVILAKEMASYEIRLSSPLSLERCSQVVKATDCALWVNIGVDKEEAIQFLADPANLPRWTGHRALYYSKEMGEWVESRFIPDSGFIEEFVVQIERLGSSGVKIEWPKRGLSVRINCLETSPCCTCVSIVLPNSVNEVSLARLKRILTIELNVLKALLEANHQEYINRRAWSQIQAYHLESNGLRLPRKLPADFQKEFPFQGEVVRSGPLYDQMSTDFAMSVRSTPQAIFRPANEKDIEAAVRIALEYDLTLTARGSQVSHSAGGQAQAIDGGILIDMSRLASIEFIGSTAVKVGTGLMWDAVIRATLDRGLMPPVLNDYQYLSVGGTISMGGVGFMSHSLGLQAGHVLEMEVVTGRGDTLVCSESQNKALFGCSRGGLGQFIGHSSTCPSSKANHHHEAFLLPKGCISFQRRR